MEFLGDAIFSAQDQTLLGAMITSFDPAQYTERAQVKLYTTSELATAYPNMKPRGFKFDAPGTLLSDTAVRRVLTDSVFSYMEEECSSLNRRTLDITDFVLQGVENNGFVFANYEDCTDPETFEVDGCFIPFRSFKVSNSSFNIYATYKNKDDVYRTFSLLNVEDGSKTEFYAVFDDAADMSAFAKNMTPCGEVSIADTAHTIYKIDLGLSGFYVGVGEAFLNYLSYNVAFYNIGEKLMKELQAAMPMLPSPSLEEPKPQIRRRARVNVSIEHIYRESRLRGINGCIGNPDELVSFIRAFPEAAITYQWLQKIYTSPWYMQGDGKQPEEQLLYTTCINLLPECRKERLKFALELLTHRYYIYLMGVVNDTLGPILKGGGVNGESIKRVLVG